MIIQVRYMHVLTQAGTCCYSVPNLQYNWTWNAAMCCDVLTWWNDSHGTVTPVTNIVKQPSKPFYHYCRNCNKLLNEVSILLVLLGNAVYHCIKSTGRNMQKYQLKHAFCANKSRNIVIICYLLSRQTMYLVSNASISLLID